MLYPMFGLVVVTYVVLITNFIWRVQAVKNRQVSIKYFRVFDGDDAPERIKAGTRHYANLFELPVLFYAACITCLALDIKTTLLVTLAWLFVLVRIIHAFIHMGANRIQYRMAVFWCAVIINCIIWLCLVWEYHLL